MSFNKIIIVGNLGRDPDLRYTPAGKAVANINVATTEKRRDRGGEMQEITTWFRVTLWGNMAENAAKYLKKGSPIYVEGRLKTDEWTDKDGNNRTTLDVNATEMQFLSSGNNNSRKQDDDSGDDSGDDYSGPDESGDETDEPAEETAPVKPKASGKKAPAKKAAGKKPAAKKDEGDGIPF
jgi:single-strand DNA-binding protein